MNARTRQFRCDPPVGAHTTAANLDHLLELIRCPPSRPFAIYVELDCWNPNDLEAASAAAAAAPAPAPAATAEDVVLSPSVATSGEAAAPTEPRTGGVPAAGTGEAVLPGSWVPHEAGRVCAACHEARGAASFSRAQRGKSGAAWRCMRCVEAGRNPLALPSAAAAAIPERGGGGAAAAAAAAVAAASPDADDATQPEEATEPPVGVFYSGSEAARGARLHVMQGSSPASVTGGANSGDGGSAVGRDARANGAPPPLPPPPPPPPPTGPPAAAPQRANEFRPNGGHVFVIQIAQLEGDTATTPATTTAADAATTTTTTTATTAATTA